MLALPIPKVAITLSQARSCLQRPDSVANKPPTHTHTHTYGHSDRHRQQWNSRPGVCSPTCCCPFLMLAHKATGCTHSRTRSQQQVAGFRHRQRQGRWKLRKQSSRPRWLAIQAETETHRQTDRQTHLHRERDRKRGGTIVSAAPSRARCQAGSACCGAGESLKNRQAGALWNDCVTQLKLASSSSSSSASASSSSCPRRANSFLSAAGRLRASVCVPKLATCDSVHLSERFQSIAVYYTTPSGARISPTKFKRRRAIAVSCNNFNHINHPKPCLALARSGRPPSQALFFKSQVS